ncbi:ATP11-domain-containing protein [Athelia psychrophila]|uniref:ATP11-domain-containing protein n=1 Tax=Athelia psychrophila TaxID=1759441 RepID=A0A166V6Q4_9AGAM|nr:ATP11-domain-containing protein [Fibularhizoctonia sp. CBS 109695]
MTGAHASRLILRSALSRNAVTAPRYGLRSLHSGTEAKQKSLADKYTEKLERAAKEKGLSVSALAAKAQEELRVTQRAEAAVRAAASAAKVAAANAEAAKAQLANPRPALDAIGKTRKDNSPVKVGTPTHSSLPTSSASSVQPLSAIMNLPRILATPHTADQIAQLWTAYHVSRSGGTGKGYICASFPLELYEKLTSISRKYPSFVVPIPRVRDGPPAEGEEDTAYEFYFLQWDFHEPPPTPSAVEADPFLAGKAQPPSENPQIATILLTPLQEYKMRASFATPYMVLTFYTDLASSHGTVLMRGEITPAGASAVPGVDMPQGTGGRHMLSQADAQLLAMEVQKFYLWNKGDKESEAQRLLRVFHDTPEEFKWEDLLKHAKL